MFCLGNCGLCGWKKSYPLSHADFADCDNEKNYKKAMSIVNRLPSDLVIYLMNFLGENGIPDAHRNRMKEIANDDKFFNVFMNSNSILENFIYKALRECFDDKNKLRRLRLIPKNQGNDRRITIDTKMIDLYDYGDKKNHIYDEGVINIMNYEDMLDYLHYKSVNDKGLFRRHLSVKDFFEYCMYLKRKDRLKYLEYNADVETLKDAYHVLQSSRTFDNYMDIEWIIDWIVEEVRDDVFNHLFNNNHEVKFFAKKGEYIFLSVSCDEFNEDYW